MAAKTGMGAFMGHSPTEGGEGGRERYAFFSLAHCGVDTGGALGTMQREGRAQPSSGCGALIGALGHVRDGGAAAQTEAQKQAWRRRESLRISRLDPEFDLLCQRVDAAMDVTDGPDATKMDLADMTLLTVSAARQDLEELIAEMVDPAAADYCVLSGVHVHNWAPVFGSDEPNVEFVIPTACYSVVQGERLNHDLLEEPPVA